MRSASQRFYIHSCICLRILIISYIATFLGTNSLSVLMCYKAVNQFTVAVSNVITSCYHVTLPPMIRNLQCQSSTAVTPRFTSCYKLHKIGSLCQSCWTSELKLGPPVWRRLPNKRSPSELTNRASWPDNKRVFVKQFGNYMSLQRQSVCYKLLIIMLNRSNVLWTALLSQWIGHWYVIKCVMTCLVILVDWSLNVLWLTYWTASLSRWTGH